MQEDCSQQSWSQQPKAALLLLHLSREALTDRDELKYLCLPDGMPGLPLMVPVVSAAPNPQNSYICVDPLVPHEGTPGEFKAHAQKHTDDVCCSANPRELCMTRGKKRGLGFFFSFSLKIFQEL